MQSHPPFNRTLPQKFNLQLLILFLQLPIQFLHIYHPVSPLRINIYLLPKIVPVPLRIPLRLRNIKHLVLIIVTHLLPMNQLTNIYLLHLPRTYIQIHMVRKRCPHLVHQFLKSISRLFELLPLQLGLSYHLPRQLTLSLIVTLLNSTTTLPLSLNIPLRVTKIIVSSPYYLLAILK